MTQKLKPKLRLLLAVLYFAAPVKAFENYFAGSRTLALANSGVSLVDEWSVSHNQAALAFFNKTVVACSYQEKFLLKQLGFSNLAFSIPQKSNAISFCAGYFGYSQYNQSKIGLAYSLKISEKISAGLQFDYFRSAIPSRDVVAQRFTLEAGLFAIPVENLKIGVHVFNPIPAKWQEHEELELPVIASFGANYIIDEKFLLIAEYKFHSTQESYPSLGFEFLPKQNLAFRIGISGGQTLYSFGFGYQVMKVGINMAFSQHKQLGTTPSIDLNYVW